MDDLGAPDAGICSACGLCCNGALFSYGTLKPEEVPAARKSSLRVFQEQDRVGIHLPCSAQRSDLSCSVYAERPSVCVDYRCSLLRRYEAGEVGRDEALARIAEAHRLVAALRKLVAEDGSAFSSYIFGAVVDRAQADGGAHDTIEWRRAHQALLFEAAAWHAFVLRHFQPEDRKPSDRSSDEPSVKGA